VQLFARKTVMTAPNTNSSKTSRPVKKDRVSTHPKPKAVKKVLDTSELRSWLDSQAFPVFPSITVNGTNHPTAVITVDFGSPIVALRLSTDQAEKLHARLRSLTRDLYSNEVNVRVSSDPQNGVFWSTVAQ
jgi:hypothetical protein